MVKALENAAKNYLNQSKERMEKDVTQVLLGKLREVIGKTGYELKSIESEPYEKKSGLFGFFKK